MKRVLSILLVLAMVVSLAACSKSDEKTDDQTQTTQAPATTDEPAKPTQDETNPATTAPDPTAEPEVTAEPTPEIPWDGAYMEKEDFLAYTAHDLETVFEAIEDQLDDAEYTAVKSVVDNGVSAIEAYTLSSACWGCRC